MQVVPIEIGFNRTIPPNRLYELGVDLLIELLAGTAPTIRGIAHVRCKETGAAGIQRTAIDPNERMKRRIGAVGLRYCRAKGALRIEHKILQRSAKIIGGRHALRARTL